MFTRLLSRSAPKLVRYASTSTAGLLPRAAGLAAAAAAYSGLTAEWTAQCEEKPAGSGRSAMVTGKAPFLTANFIADAAEKASPALVNITVTSMMKKASGSGFVVDSSGLIFTNTHVVGDAMRNGAAVTVTLSDGVTSLKGTVTHADALADVAIVRVKPSKPLATATLGSSANLRPGEFVVALGAPMGLSNSVSAGIISAVARMRSEIVGRSEGARANAMAYIQTDAAINQGNSGGPLLNLQGEVIGINTMKAAHADGIGFALPIDDVKRVVNQLQKHGRVMRPWLGVKFVELDPKIATSLREKQEGRWRGGGGGGPPDQGLHVLHVDPDSPAHNAGVRVGDTITALNGRPVRTTKELIDKLVESVGAKVAMDLERQGQQVSVSCKVESWSGTGAREYW